MPDPIKMPAPPLAPGQIEVKLGFGPGARRYVLNVPAEDEPVTVEPPDVVNIDAAKFHRNAFALVWPALGEEPKP